MRFGAAFATLENEKAQLPLRFVQLELATLPDLYGTSETETFSYVVTRASDRAYTSPAPFCM